MAVKRLERAHGIIHKMYEAVDKPSDLHTAYPYLVIPLTMQNENKATFQNELPLLSEMPMQKAYYV